MAWAPATDPSGRTYYYNTQTMDVTWECPAGARALQSMLAAQREIEDRARSHAAARLRTCLRFSEAGALQRALRAWEGFSQRRPARDIVPRVACALSAWMRQREETVAAVNARTSLQDDADELRVRVLALESAERAEAEFDRLRRNRRRVHSGD